MKLLFRDSAMNSTTTYNVAREQYGSFLVRFAGTAAAGQTVAAADLGNVILNWNGGDVVNVDAEMLANAANLYGGAVEATSAQAGAFAFSFIIPCGAWNDPRNIYDVNDKDKVYIKLDFAALSAKIASGTVSINAKPRTGIMSYFHKILSRSVVAGGAGTITDTINAANISELYVKNPAALVSTMQISKDGKTYVDNDAATELSYSNWIHQVESAGTFLGVEFIESGDLRQSLSKQLTYKYVFTGAGTLAQYYSSIEFSAQKQAESIVTARANANK